MGWEEAGMGIEGLLVELELLLDNKGAVSLFCELSVSVPNNPG